MSTSTKEGLCLLLQQDTAVSASLWAAPEGVLSFECLSVGNKGMRRAGVAKTAAHFRAPKSPTATKTAAHSIFSWSGAGDKAVCRVFTSSMSDMNQGQSSISIVLAVVRCMSAGAPSLHAC